MNIDQWLHDAADQLKQTGIQSYRLDAEILLANALERERVYVHAHGQDELAEQQRTIADALLQRRRQRIPIAYILGHKEFYGRDFSVSSDVLIPRPETESIIELIEGLAVPEGAAIADIGTGSGAIAITLALNNPARHVTAIDVSERALAVARSNAKRLHAEVTFVQGDLLVPLTAPTDVIVANLPYVDPEWERSPETDFEPELALFANNHGLALIEKLLSQVPTHLAPAGYVVLEADPDQHKAIIATANRNSLRHIRTKGYGILLQR